MAKPTCMLLLSAAITSAAPMLKMSFEEDLFSNQNLPSLTQSSTKSCDGLCSIKDLLETNDADGIISV